MKISTKGRYALRLMLDLAMNDQGNPVRVREIAGEAGHLGQVSGADYFHSDEGGLCEKHTRTAGRIPSQ